jgi:hypothetical protein
VVDDIKKKIVKAPASAKSGTRWGRPSIGNGGNLFDFNTMWL